MTFPPTIPTETQEGIVSHLESKTPFILYLDKANYVRYYPNTLRVYAYTNGVMISEVKATEEEDFSREINGAIQVGCDKFFSLIDEAPRANKTTTEEAVRIDHENIIRENMQVYEEDRLLDGT